jgi:hypothetical protein
MLSHGYASSFGVCVARRIKTRLQFRNGELITQTARRGKPNGVKNCSENPAWRKCGNIKRAKRGK